MSGYNLPRRSQDYYCYLLSPHDVIPDGGAAKVDVEVCVAAGHGHEAVLLHLGVHHPPHVVGSVLLVLLEMSRPHVVHPVNLPDHPGGRHVAVQLGLTELQADHVELGVIPVIITYVIILIIVMLQPVRVHEELFPVLQ